MANTEILKVPCPCIECICVPICRHKNYQDLILQCIIVHDILLKGTTERFIKLVRQVEEHLHPSLWSVTKREITVDSTPIELITHAGKRDITNG